MKCKLLALFVSVAIALTFMPKITVTASYVDDFLATVGPMCTSDMKSNKILASFTMAQAIYESGWGRSTLAVEANNLFGMRAYSSWTGKVYDRNEGVLYNSWSEMVSKKGSSYVNNNSMAFWRAFDSWQESVNSHSELFNTSSRYSNLRGNYDYKACCKLVVEDGYCTDSGYTENLINLIESYDLEQYNYNFAANGEDGSVKPEEEPYLGENLFAGLTVDYYLKGKWSEFSGTTALPTDGKYRGNGTVAWSGNSAVSGVTFDTADYNSTNSTINYFVFNMAEPVDVSSILIRGYRENGNRGYATLEVFAGADSINVDASNYEAIEEAFTKLNHSIEKNAITDAPQSSGSDQYYNLNLSFETAEKTKSIIIKTNANYASNAFFQFDEIAAYAPLDDSLPFTFVEEADTSSVNIDADKGFITLKNGCITAENLTAIFSDENMAVTDSDGNLIDGTMPVGTGYVITTTINNATSSLLLAVCGDINGDASISAADYIALSSCIKGSVVFSDTSMCAADVDCSGAISTTDYIVLKSMLV